VIGQQQQDEISRMEGTACFDQLQAPSLYGQDNLRKGQDTQMAEVNRSERPWTLEVGDFVMLSTQDMPITHGNQCPSRQKMQHPGVGPYKIIMFCAPNAVELELLADIMIHDTQQVSRLKQYTADRTPDEPPTPTV